ncbi:hypothetical protein APA_2587 [Pseudanabaena sp. lw0831]|nr:hypothetical protein APA_2587 [Pseudanabaena sp. lw0831]
MTLSNRASFISSCPITAVKGNTGRLVVTVGLMGVAIKVFKFCIDKIVTLANIQLYHR